MRRCCSATIVNFGPQRTIGQRTSLSGDQRRSPPARVNGKVKRSVPAALGKAKAPFAAIEIAGSDLVTGDDCDSGVARGPKEDVEQSAAVDTKTERLVIQCSIRNVERRSLARHPVQAIDPRAECHRFFRHAKRPQNRNSGRLKHQATANGSRLGEALEQLHSVAVPGQHRRYRQPADPAARDTDVQLRPHCRSLSPTS